MSCFFSFLVVAAIILTFPRQAESNDGNDLEPVVLQLKWRHQFQFAGCYAALEQGYYRDAGLKVELRELVQGEDYVEEVLSGRADYGIGNSYVLQQRLGGKPLVALAVVFQNSPYLLLTLRDSGITGPTQMSGKRVLVSESARPITEAMLRAEGVDPASLEYVPPTKWRLSALEDGICDVLGAYATNEPFFLSNAGVQTNTISPRSYGVDFYEDILFSSERTVEKHPERTQRFLAATLKGWEYALDHPDEIIDLLLDTYKSGKSRDLLEFEARETRRLIMPDLVEVGHRNPGRWQNMADTLKELGVVDSADIQSFVYDPADVRQEYLERVKKWLIITLVVAVALGGLALLWARMLKRLVNVRTRELAESEARFRAIFENVRDAVFIHEMLPDGQPGPFRDFNDIACERLGYTREELQRMTPASLDEPEIIAGIVEQAMRDLRSRGYALFESVQIAKDGSRIPVENNARLVDVNGRKVIFTVSRDITTQKQARKKLEAAIARLNEAQMLGRSGDWDWNPETDVVTWSESMYHILELDPDQSPPDYEGQLTLYHPESAERLHDAVRKAIELGEPYILDLSRTKQNGEVVYLQARGFPEMGSDGHLVRLKGTIQDITEQKKLSLERERYARHLQRVLEATADGIWEWDISTDTLSFSPTYYTMLGYEPDEFPPSFETWLDLVHPEDQASAREHAESWLKSMPGTYESFFRMRTKQGDYRWIESRAKVAEYDSSGAPKTLIGNHVDVTARHQAQQDLVQAHARLSFHVENSPLAVIEWENGTHISLWSRQAENIFGWKAEEVLGKSWDDFSFIYPEDQEVVKNQVSRLFDGSDKYNTVVNRNYTKYNSVVHCHWYNSLVRDEKGNVISILSQVADVTELKKYEQELLEAKEAAEEASKTKSEFLANMSHEIRTPLNGILGMLQLLQITKIDREQEEYVINAIQSSTRLTRLLSDILDLSRIEANRLSIQSAPLNLAETVEDTCELFKPTARQTGVELICHVDPKVPHTLKGDATRLQQVLTNLVGNAFKFTVKGKVVVDADYLGARDQKSCRVLFSVSDTGIGMPADKIGSLFRPFCQLSSGYRRDHQGAGLGLSICKRLVELMGGSIFIESEPDKGTTVYFYVTFSLDEPVSEQVTQSPAPGRTHALKILLAEDEKVNRLATTKLLERQGHTVTSAENGQEAISLLKDNGFDVVLMDVQMPVMDGVEATRSIRSGNAGSQKQNIPIIAMTAYARDGDKEKFLSEKMNAYIAKPVDIEKLEALLQHVLGGNDYA